jgi:hypothetical protein
MTDDPWKDVTAAKLPAVHLKALAPVRAEAEVRVLPAGDAIWVRWPAKITRVIQCLRPVPGVVFFSFRDGVWFRLCHRLPSAECPPDDTGSKLAAVLVPDRLEPVSPPAGTVSRVTLGIVRGGEPQTATALVCETVALAKWADTATSAELAVVEAARCGSRTVLLGKNLPVVPSGVRYWGESLLVPLGFRADPELPATVLRAAAGATADELVLLDDECASVIPRAAFERLSRAGLRLARRGVP